jgi:hypothetical protein
MTERAEERKKQIEELLSSFYGKIRAIGLSIGKHIYQFILPFNCWKVIGTFLFTLATLFASLPPDH